MSEGLQDSAERIAALLERLVTPMVLRAEQDEKRRCEREATAEATGDSSLLVPFPGFTGVAPVQEIRHVVILSGQLTVVKDNGECWTLGREGGMSNAPLEWQQLPTVPGFGGATESSAL